MDFIICIALVWIAIVQLINDRAIVYNQKLIIKRLDYIRNKLDSE